MQSFPLLLEKGEEEEEEEALQQDQVQVEKRHPLLVAPQLP
jgi:hypothetical protein